MSPLMNGPRALRGLLGRIDHKVIPRPKIPAPRTGPIIPTFRPPGGELYERSKALSPKGGLDSCITAASYGEESSIVRGAIQPSPTLDKQMPKESTHTVINTPKQMVPSASTSKVPPWQLYKEYVY